MTGALKKYGVFFYLGLHSANLSQATSSPKTGITALGKEILRDNFEVIFISYYHQTKGYV